MGRQTDEQGVQGEVRSPAPEQARRDVVTADYGRWLPSKRRRRRILAVLLVLWAAFAVLVAWGWHQYGRLSHELRVSNGRVGAPVKRALTPAPSGAPRQTTLVAGIDSHRHAAGSVILVRTDSTRHAVELLTVPSTVRVSTAQRLRDVLRFDGVPRAIGILGADLGVPINHLLLMRLDQAGSIVRSLHGIVITNPTPVPYRVTGGSGVYPAGRVALTGKTVQWYLDPVPSAHPPAADSAAAGDFRQAAVVRGVTDKLIHLTTPSSISAVGRTVSHNFTTDLSPDPVLSMVAARLRATTLLRCRLAADAQLAQAASDATVTAFKAASRRGACTAEALHTTVPGAAVAATIIATIVDHGGSGLLYWSVVATIALLGIGLTAWVLMLPSVRGVRRMPRARALPTAPASRRRTLPRPALPAMPELSRPALPRMTLPRMSGMALPRVGRPSMPHVSLPGMPRIGRAEPSPYRHRRRFRSTYGAALLIRVISVPVSVGLGILIARVLS